MRLLLIFLILAIVTTLIWFFAFSKFSPLKQKIITHQENRQVFQITEPENGDVLTLQELKIDGKTRPDTYLAVFSQNDSQIIKTQDTGEFNTSLNLADGYNLIKLVNFETDGSYLEQTLEVFYLSSKFEKLVQSPISTQSAQTNESLKRLGELRKKQNLKIAAGILKGTLAKSLAIETLAGSRTVVVSDSTKIGNFPDFAKSLQEVSQIKAGDFVVAVGNFAQQGILTAQILQVNPNIRPEFRNSTVFGIVEKANEDIFELTNPRNGNKTQVLVNSAKIFNEAQEEFKTKDITVGNKLVVIGQPEKENFVAEAIMVISGNYLSELEKFTTPVPTTQSATKSAN